MEVWKSKDEKINSIPGVQDKSICIHYLCTPTNTGCFKDEKVLLTYLFSKLNFTLQISYKLTKFLFFILQ